MTWGQPSPEVLARDFLAQNELCAVALRDDDVVQWAEHHAGGLIVLGGYVVENDAHYCKMHDSWGGDENIVVHEYDVNDPDGFDVVEEFGTDGVAARARFLELVL